MQSILPICTLTISNDCNYIILVTKESECYFQIEIYSLITHQKVFVDPIAGDSKYFIRAKDVEQNEKGNKFCVPFIDDGHFYIKTF